MSHSKVFRCVLGMRLYPVSLLHLEWPLLALTSGLLFSTKCPPPSQNLPLLPLPLSKTPTSGFLEDCLLTILSPVFSCRNSVFLSGCKLLQVSDHLFRLRTSPVPNTFLFIKPREDKGGKNGLHNVLNSEPRKENWVRISLLPQKSETLVISPDLWALVFAYLNMKGADAFFQVLNLMLHE